MVKKKWHSYNKRKVAQLPIFSVKEQKILSTLDDYKYGIQAKKLSEITDIPRRSLFRMLSKLEHNGIIEKQDHFWRVCQIQSGSLKWHTYHSKKNTNMPIQCHNISFVLRLIDKPFWWHKRHNYLLKLKEFYFKQTVTWGNNPYEILKKDNFIIQTFASSIVFFNKKHYYGTDSYDCFIQALEDTLEMYAWFEERLKFKFFKDGVPQFQVRTRHYVKLKDIIAEKCKKARHGFEITIDGHLRAWVDMSEPLGFETGHKDYAPEDMQRYAEFIGDILQNKPPLPSEIAKREEFIINALVDYSKNIKTHVSSIIALKQGIDEFNKRIDILIDYGKSRSKQKKGKKKDD